MNLPLHAQRSIDSQLATLALAGIDEVLASRGSSFFTSQARPEQQPPPGDWFGWLYQAGRGAGKTRTGAELCHEWARQMPGCHIAIVGQTVPDVRDVMVEHGDSSILKIARPGFVPLYRPHLRRLEWPNGSSATTYSGDSPDQLRGPQHHAAWVDELAKFQYPDETWSNLELGLRLGEKPRVFVSTTPRPIKLLKDLAKDPAFVVTRGSTKSNEANLPASFIARVYSKYQDTRLGRQEIEGELLGDMPGALWTYELLDREGARWTGSTIAKMPPGALTQAVVGVDPSGSSDDPESAEVGIVLAASTYDRHYAVLADYSGRYSPEEWGEKAIHALMQSGAAYIVVEENFGGAMVETVIRTAEKDMRGRGLEVPDVMVKRVRAAAKQNKKARAMPVSMLWEQGRGHLAGRFPELEDQMTSFSGQHDEASDRLDAMVYAVTALMGTLEVEVV